MIPWWQGLAPVDTDGPVEGHRLMWRDGGFSLASHPDPEADRALVALGGERCACLDVYDAWNHQHESAAILTVGPRSMAETITLGSSRLENKHADVARWRRQLDGLRAHARAEADGAALGRLEALGRPGERDARRRLGFLRLLTLAPLLQHRLQASVAATLAAEGRLERLSVAAAARALPLLRSLGWTGELAGIETVPDTAAGELGRDLVRLPAGWLSEVWGRGLGVLDGRFVLGITAFDASTGVLEVMTAALGKPGVAVGVVQWENA